MDNKINNDQYVEASSGARVILVILLVLGLGSIYLLAPLLENMSPAEDAGIKEIEQAIAQLASLVDYLLLFSLLFSSILSIFFIRLGLLTSETGRYPPPGFSVIRRTRVLTGQQAKKFVGLSYMFAVFGWLPVVATLYLKWLVSSIT